MEAVAEELVEPSNLEKALAVVGYSYPDGKVRPVKVRKQAVEVEVMLLLEETADAVLEWIDNGRPSYEDEMDGKFVRAHRATDGEGIAIFTPEGLMRASWGDFVICGVAGEFYPCKPQIFADTYSILDPDNNFMRHAKTELSYLGMSTEEQEPMLRIIHAFAVANVHGSNSSVGWYLETLRALLNFENLTRLTDDPSEWIEIGEGVWQSKRNMEAFSLDGGESFYILSERSKSPNPDDINTWEFYKTKSPNEPEVDFTA